MLGFLPLVLVVFRILANRNYHFPAMVWLTTASAAYYAWWNSKYLLLLFTSIVVNYVGGLLLEKLFRLNRSRAKKLSLVVLIGFNLGLLGYYKYAGFLSEIINSTGLLSLEVRKVVLPLAISFYTFEQLSYIFDVSSGVPAERRFINYSLFALFFPRLIAGPIVQGRWILPFFDKFQTYSLNYNFLIQGLSMFAIGLFKKGAIADSIAPFADIIFTSSTPPVLHSVFETWMGIASYTFQLYFDFSGYSDMAIGLGLMFGIPLPINFNSPYKSKNIREFWQKWHITLGEFLTNYLYRPLLHLFTEQKNTQSTKEFTNNLVLPSIFASVVTMFLAGVWHGAGWNFVVFGALHGLYFVVLSLWELFFPEGFFSRRPNFRMAWTANLLTLVSVMIGWVFFRSKDLKTAWTVLSSAFYLRNGIEIMPKIIDFKQVTVLVFLSGVVFFMPNSQQLIVERLQNLLIQVEQPVSTKIHRLLWLSSSIAVGLILATGFLCLGDSAVFLYFNF
jgi:D-alanyl-lipoteichoic acid acyltransferase DltB (MBOAT superfamily)